mmetsp:Transcript_5088/g.11140  ORF Transcript_5088/g.11140 Transcript_5088/m.11140 type:complete len:333 (-) Transcript_5088:5785-6783(-)
MDGTEDQAVCDFICSRVSGENFPMRGLNCTASDVYLLLAFGMIDIIAVSCYTIATCASFGSRLYRASKSQGQKQVGNMVTDIFKILFCCTLVGYSIAIYTFYTNNMTMHPWRKFWGGLSIFFMHSFFSSVVSMKVSTLTAFLKKSEKMEKFDGGLTWINAASIFLAFVDNLLYVLGFAFMDHEDAVDLSLQTGFVIGGINFLLVLSCAAVVRSVANGVASRSAGTGMGDSIIKRINELWWELALLEALSISLQFVDFQWGTTKTFGIFAWMVMYSSRAYMLMFYDMRKRSRKTQNSQKSMTAASSSRKDGSAKKTQVAPTTELLPSSTPSQV